MNEISTTTFDDLPIDLQRGLDAEQIRQSAEKYGSNMLTPPKRDPWWTLLLGKFDDPTIKILLVAAVVSLLMTILEKYVLAHPDASFIDSIGIILAVMLATLCGFFSELKSAREFDLLNKVKDDIKIKVLREGQMDEISINEIVVGDLVHLDLGDKVPADGVVLDAMGLLVDQSVMTGESVPVEKSPLPPKEAGVSTPAPLTPDIAAKLDDRHQVYRGTMISDGHGMFLVTEVGDRTRLGQIAANLGKEGETESETPLTHKLGVLARQISVVGMTGAMTIFAVMAMAAIWRSRGFVELVADVRHFSNLESAALLGIGSLVLGFLAMRFGLLPFFSSMGIKIRNPLFQLLACIPLIVGIFGMGLGIQHMIDGIDGEYVVFNESGAELPDSSPSVEEQAVGQSMELFRSLLTCFIIAVTIIVVAVPEGLPMMVTVSLAMNMMKMARENVLVRKLVASETIGSATIVCTDKTGTLTQNRMRTTWMLLGMEEFDLSDNQSTTRQLVSPAWNFLVESIAINSEASLHIEAVDGRQIVEGIGNPTECALLTMLHDAGVDYRDFRDRFPRLWELSHNSQRKMSLVVVDRGEKDGNRKTCFIKGAPDRLVGRCTQVYVGDRIEPIENRREEIDAALARASARALRVIAFTVKNGDGQCFDEERGEECLECPGHTLLALIGISDPIRPEIRAAVETCHQAGVEVKMITGDAEPTAVAIAKQAGIISESFDPTDDNDTEIRQGELVLTSAELAEMDDQKLLEAIPSLKVLARSTPMDKLRLVKAMHRQGEVVAMTGDGTNDAPALKFADVGVSMGITGTEVAKEASDIVLIDDNFKSIVTGIWWGRTLYQNIQRFLQFQLSVNVVALSCALIGPLIGIPLPLTVPQLLWINIIMDTFAAIGYSTDPPRAGSMRRKPISRDASIITPSMGLSILLSSVYQVLVLFSVLYFGLFLESGHTFTYHAESRDPANLQALTVFFTVFVMFQFWHKFNCRSLRYDESPFELLNKNRLFIFIIVVITVIQIVMVQASDAVPAIGRIFRTETLSLKQWIGISLLTATIIPVAWLIRQAVHRLGLDEKPNV